MTQIAVALYLLAFVLFVIVGGALGRIAHALEALNKAYGIGQPEQDDQEPQQ